MAEKIVNKKNELPIAPQKQTETAPKEVAPSFDLGAQVETSPTASPEINITKETKESAGIQIEEKNRLAEVTEGISKKLKKPKKKQLQDISPVRDELTKEVETIMEAGLKDAFRELSPAEAQAFKIKGEETALEIRKLLKSAHIKVKKIFKLLFEWLKLLPGINSFFLQQEAKIKADKIMAIHRKHVAMRSHITTK